MSPVSNILSSEACIDSTRSAILPTTDFILKNFPDSNYELVDTPPSGSFNDTLESQSLASSSTTNGTNGSSAPSLLCKWFGCGREIVSTACSQSIDNGVYISQQTDASTPEEERDLLLLDHLMTQHVQAQSSKRRKYFTCYWTDCKVYRKPSLSYKWLESHILCHLENAKARRPFRCLFECPKRFSSRLQLERHINAIHLRGTSPVKLCKTSSKELPSSKTFTSASKTVSFCKNLKKKRVKKIRGFRVRSVDFYDPRTQAQVTNKLILNAIQHEPVSFSINSSPSSISDNSPTKYTRTLNANNTPLNLVKKGVLDGPSFSTRSMSRQSSLETLPCVLDDAILSEQDSWKYLSPTVKKLLSLPYAILGRRCLANRNTEVLIKWFTDDISLPNEWIAESDFSIASELGSPRSKRQMCRAPSGFRIQPKSKLNCTKLCKYASNLSI